MRKNMKYRLVIPLFVLLVAAFLIGGGSIGPSKEKVGEFAIRKFNPIPQGVEQPYAVHELEIIKAIQNEINGKNIFLYNIRFKVREINTGKILTGERTQTLDGIVNMTITIMKEGNHWKCI